LLSGLRLHRLHGDLGRGLAEHTLGARAEYRFTSPAPRTGRESAAAGDPMCREIFRVQARALGLFFDQMVNTFDPDALIIGGGVIEAAQDYSLFHILIDYSLDLWKQQLALIRQRNGLMSFICHPDYLIEQRARTVYESLLLYLRQMIDREKVWLALPGAVDRWWRASHSRRATPYSGNPCRHALPHGNLELRVSAYAGR
jgi:hypothetical protein